MLDTTRRSVSPARRDITSSSAHRSGLGVAVAGMLLIAATYGMARFGVGLFAPRLAQERPELIEVLGAAAAAQFLASPALVPVIDAVVARGARATAQSVVNTGTGVGVIGAGLVAFSAPSVGSAWVVMAGLSAAAAAAVILPLRGRTDLGAAARTGGGSQPGVGEGSDRQASTTARLTWRKLLLPGTAAVVVGAGSALIWTFGPLLASDSGVVAAAQVGWLWIALGAGGLLGSFTGVLVTRLGEPAGFGVTAGVLAVASGVLAWALLGDSGAAAYASMAIFGAGYMALSGVLILSARRVWPGHAGAGTSVLFIALATGQAVGSAGFGLGQGSWNPAVLAAVAASLCLVGGGLATIRAWKPRAGN